MPGSSQDIEDAPLGTLLSEVYVEIVKFKINSRTPPPFNLSMWPGLYSIKVESRLKVCDDEIKISKY